VVGGALAGLLVGILYLARSEGALFGVPLVALAIRRETRFAGAIGSLAALVIGGAWFARDLSLGTGDLLFRTVLLVRYEDFFAVGGSTGLGGVIGPTDRLSAFFPFGIALAAAGAERLAFTRGQGVLAAWIAGALVLTAAMSIGAIVEWDATFNAAAGLRAAALDAIPAGPFMAIDAAAWR